MSATDPREVLAAQVTDQMGWPHREPTISRQNALDTVRSVLAAVERCGVSLSVPGGPWEPTDHA